MQSQARNKGLGYWGNKGLGQNPDASITYGDYGF